MPDLPLPLLLSLPHAGLIIAPEVADLCLLTPADLIADSDEAAAEIYALEGEVAGFVACPIARPIVDVNRPEEDAGRDGALKELTRRGGQPIYRAPLPDELRRQLLQRHHRPYHRRLSELAPAVRLGIDCHTMSARRPAATPPAGVAPDDPRWAEPEPVPERPRICLSDAEHTCDRRLFYGLMRALEDAFDCVVSLNLPFKGGHTIRSHAHELPWVQLELSRAAYDTNAGKRTRLLRALRNWCRTLENV